jgi:hypothetical protein
MAISSHAGSGTSSSSGPHATPHSRPAVWPGNPPELEEDVQATQAEIAAAQPISKELTHDANQQRHLGPGV